MTKAIKIQADKNGKRYAICAHRDGGFAVYVECSNYAGHVRGGIAKTWRLAEKGLDLVAAETLLARRCGAKREVA